MRRTTLEDVGLLIAAALAHADETGLERMVLKPTDRAIPFYRRHGFGPADVLLVRPHPLR